MVDVCTSLQLFKSPRGCSGFQEVNDGTMPIERSAVESSPTFVKRKEYFSNIDTVRATNDRAII